MNSLSGRTGHSEIPAIEHSGTVHTRAKDKANIFCQTFAEKMQARRLGISSTPRGYSAPSSHAGEYCLQNPKTSQRSYALSSRTKLLVLTKFRVEVLKECAAELASPLCRLFRLCFANGTFPDQWKTCLCHPSSQERFQV